RVRSLQEAKAAAERKALEEASGDFEKAKKILRRKGAEASAQAAHRTLGAGAVAAYLHHGGSIGAMVVLSCETDFVSGNEEFKALAHDVAMHVAALSPEFIKKEDVSKEARAGVREALLREVAGKPKEMQEKILLGKLSKYFGERTLLEQPFVKNPEMTVGMLLDSAVQKFGERIEISRFVRFAAGNRA
ncbi:MAG: elongation factor T, partial [Parcubacteria group bacterium Greene0416_79]